MLAFCDVDNQARIIGDELDVTRNTLLSEDLENSDQEEGDRSWIEERGKKFIFAFETFIEMAQLTRTLNRGWRSQVYSGDTLYSESVNQLMKTFYTTWIFLADKFKEKAAFFERHEFPLPEKLVETLDQHKKEATETLQKWRVPARTIGPSFKRVKLSPEANARLKELYPDLFPS